MPNWGQVLAEIQADESKLAHKSKSAIDNVRRKYLRRLNKHTGRNVIGYYSGWLTNPRAPGIDVNDEDKAAFMMAIHGLDKSKGLDLILHTPGGGIAAAESLVDYLRRVFGTDIRAIVPHLAMSAGTMIACSCKSIVMGKQSNLGPIDPQLNGLPAAAVTKEIERAIREIKESPERLQFWQFVLNKYSPTFVGQCEQAIKMAAEFVRARLLDNMLIGIDGAEGVAEAIVSGLSDVEENKSHARHIHIDKCQDLGLKIECLEDDQDLQEAVLTVHHCYMHSLGVSGASKMVENHQGAAFVKIPT
ncbi:ATP-dependent protease ClpP protease subunit [Sphingomonas kyeonggiensis]|uniref:ATP-dependent protease ClpP protease subunit n=1 Tax=Sphingomonas kyeonggiensis TaxID=1268553 RepID=A0A7W7JZB8_9SPHN|nr:S49 family peptidase [Sphingomonas kyeonggiensis]MBB4838059.1 ATP-dependent protease ClpP protease subunit [Sphingomonas kyeonggiensis]